MWARSSMGYALSVNQVGCFGYGWYWRRSCWNNCSVIVYTPLSILHITYRRLRQGYKRLYFTYVYNGPMLPISHVTQDMNSV